MKTLTHAVPGRFLAFTLVELIVVITIVGILSTVGFVSFSGYLTSARDSNRFSQLTKLSDSLQVYAATKSLPLPEDYIEITASGASNVIAYQGYVGVDVLETIDYTNGGRDPKDESFFTYYLTKDRNSLQLMALMEDANSVTYRNTNMSYAANYENRYPKVYGKKLGILISAEEATLNTPAQEIGVNKTSGFLDIFNTTQVYTALIDEKSLTASGYTLGALLSTRLGQDAPTDCPTGFIGVPGNPEFKTQGFCVAQYEMTYTDADTPNSVVSTDWNTVSYVPGKIPVSQAGKYPVVNITQSQAIDACNSMGFEYQLITNEQWMTIARSIESNSSNWTSGIIGVGSIYNGVSNDTTLGCDKNGGNTEPRTFATKTGPGADTVCNARRSHKLNQGGGVIWDLSGNVWEHVNKGNTMDGINFNQGQTTILGSSTPSGPGWDDDGIYNNEDMKKYGSASFLGINHGMGSIFAAGGSPGNVVQRGRSAFQGSNTGIYTIHLGWTDVYSSRELGFRCTMQGL